MNLRITRDMSRVWSISTSEWNKTEIRKERQVRRSRSRFLLKIDIDDLQLKSSETFPRSVFKFESQDDPFLVLLLERKSFVSAARWSILDPRELTNRRTVGLWTSRFQFESKWNMQADRLPRLPGTIVAPFMSVDRKPAVHY